MIEHRLTLSYRLGAGWLTPWVEALGIGKALGYRCAECRKTSFPPERCCSCGCTEGAWEPLSGEAEIVERTDGPEGSFGLVRFDGAQTHSSARLDGVAMAARRARLKPVGEGLPAIVLTTDTEATP